MVTVEEKADRLRAEARVQVKFCTEGVVSAAVRGDHGVYDVQWSRLQGWTCSCPAFKRCSHVEAVCSVTMRPVGR